jgi:hypothetical protein
MNIMNIPTDDASVQHSRMKQAAVNQFRAELWRAAGPTLACIGILIAVLVLMPAISAVSHAYARMDAHRRGEHPSILDMTPSERDGIMTKHHVELLTSLHKQLAVMGIRRQQAEDAQASHPSAANGRAVWLIEKRVGYMLANYNDIARQTPVGALNYARLPHTLP